MRYRLVLPMKVVVLVPLAMLVGCEKCCRHGTVEARPMIYKPDTVDPWLVEASRDLSTEKAIVRQHTLFPYHFVEYGAALNELGRHDMDILIRHYRQYPGPVNARRGDDTPDALYQARVATVRDALAAGGVNVQQVNFTDGLAGGDGLAGEHALIILQAPTQASTPDRTVTVTPVTVQPGPSK